MIHRLQYSISSPDQWTIHKKYWFILLQYLVHQTQYPLFSLYCSFKALCTYRMKLCSQGPPSTHHHQVVFLRVWRFSSTTFRFPCSLKISIFQSLTLFYPSLDNHEVKHGSHSFFWKHTLPRLSYFRNLPACVLKFQQGISYISLHLVYCDKDLLGMR